MTPQRFQLEQWSAWAAGLESPEAWLRWLSAPHALTANGVPALAEVPAITRRRIDPLGRIALQSAYWAQGAELSGPVVFASRWGEIERAVQMLEQLAAGESLSPTAFGLSVHNAIGALYSIARKDRNNYQAVSAGDFSVEAGFVEVAGLLADGAERVLLVYFDGPLPPAYASFESLAAENAQQFPHAFACMLRRAERGGIALGTQAPASARTEPANALPPGLTVLQFLLGTQPALRRAAPSADWVWTRNAG